MTKKLSKDQIIEIFQSSGYYGTIAAKYGVHPTTVRHIKEGYLHIHVTAELEPGAVAPAGRPKKQART